MIKKSWRLLMLPPPFHACLQENKCNLVKPDNFRGIEILFPAM